MVKKDLLQLQKLVRFARKNGLKHIKFGEIEFEFSHPPVFLPKSRVQLPKGEPITGEKDRDPTEDEMLFWSTETFDHLRRDRAESLDKPKN